MKRLISKTFKWNVPFVLAVFLIAVVSSAGAQDSELEKTLKKLSEGAAKAYVTPLVSAFGSNLNGGWFHKAPRATLLSLNLEFGLVGMATLFPEETKFQHFNIQEVEFRFDQEQAQALFDNTGLDQTQIDLLAAAISSIDFNASISGATIVGTSDDYITIELDGQEVPDVIDPRTGQPIEVGGTILLKDSAGNPIGGLGDFLSDIFEKTTPFLPFVAPQVTVGTILGTQFTFRYVPEAFNSLPFISAITDDIGEISWTGWGIQHNPKAILPIPFPLDISLGLFKQTLKVGEILEANTTAYGITVSKRLGVGAFNITPYAGYMQESSNINFSYNFVVDDQEIPVEFEIEGKNTNRMIVGLGLRLLMFNFNADYNFGNYHKSATFGLMIAF
jgi:hypothetical protein